MNHSARFLRTALTTAVLGVCLAATASAMSYGVGTVTGDALRLRQDSSTDSTILTTAVQGTEVLVLEDQRDGWYKVAVSGDEGYMSAEYLSVSVKANADLGAGVLNTDGSTLNLRSGPGSDYDKLAAIPASATLTVTGINNGWYKTSYNGTVGYVSSDYVLLSDLQGGGKAASSARSETGIPNTDGDPLNLRSGPGTSYDKLASIPASATLTITGSENGWYKVSYAGVTGYVSGDYVLLGASQPSVPANADLGAQVVAYAKQFLGIPYVYGANGPNAYDCSSFTGTVYRHFGYSLNRSAAGQYSNGTPIDQSQMQPGDLILWRAYGSSRTATHVGIYIGNNQYIHASSSGGCIIINDMDYAVNSRYVVGVRRILL